MVSYLAMTMILRNLVLFFIVVLRVTVSTTHSGECRLMSRSCALGEQALRLCLRFHYRVQMLHGIFLHPERVLGLITNQGERELDFEYSALMSEALGNVHIPNLDEVFYAVRSNCVAIEIDGIDYGAAVYPPAFSWFNHSCSPEAAWRFEFHGEGIGGSFLVSPHGRDEEIVRLWSNDFIEFDCRGPQIAMRSIQPLRKGQQVHVSYIDNVVPKDIRRHNLKDQSFFVCNCIRCSASPMTIVDQVLSENFYPLSREGGVGNFPWALLDSTVSRGKLLGDDGKYDECIKCFELMFFELFNYDRVPLKASSTFKGHTLHPLHYKVLEAYGYLKTVFKEFAIEKIEKGDKVEGVRLRKAGAAFSLLSAGALYNLFCLDPSFVRHLGTDWLDAGDFLLMLYEDLNYSEPRKIEGKCFSCNHPKVPTSKDGPFLESDFEKTYKEFAVCIGKLIVTVWPLLIMDLHCLKSINNPFDLKWLQRSKVMPGDESLEYDMGYSLKQLGLHCYGFGSYFISIGSGPDCATLVHLRERLAE